MNIEEIIQLWQKDAEIDKTELGDESLKIPKLHHKYYQILITERLLLRKLESDMKQLKLNKYEFYKDGHNDETREKGWILPSKGMILKSDIPMYIDGDKDIVNLSLKIGLQQEKIEFLDSIIRSIMNRGYIIKNSIEWARFTMGG
jgi:hypothetical protein